MRKQAMLEYRPTIKPYNPLYPSWDKANLLSTLESYILSMIIRVREEEESK